MWQQLASSERESSGPIVQLFRMKSMARSYSNGYSVQWAMDHTASDYQNCRRQCSKFNYYTHRWQNRQQSIKLSEDSTVSIKPIKTLKAHVVAVEYIYYFTCHGQLPPVKEEGLAQSEVYSTVIRHSRQISLVRQKIIRAGLAIESWNRLPTAIAPFTVKIPGFGKTIACVGI